ncbi:protein kinase [Haematococcus lacustris]
MVGAPDATHDAARRQAITELLFFASVGDLYRCKKIVSAWNLNLRDPLTADYDKRTPLHLAAAEGCYSATAWLLSCGVAVNPVDRFQRTPLEDAVRGDHGEVASLIIQAGGRVLNKDLELVELADSPLAGNVRIFTEFNPEWEVDPASLVMMEKIGEGEFGIVHKASWHGTHVAVKILKETGAVALGDFRTELNVLQKVHHPHTVQFLGAVTRSQPFMIVTEFIGGGSLTDMFRSQRTPTLWRAAQLALDCARGLAYLHARQPQAVIHRDLKPANLMIGGGRLWNSYHRNMCVAETGMLKIADFGLSKSLKMPKSKRNPHNPLADSSQSAHGGSGYNMARQAEGDHCPAYKLTGETGSYRYMAPEVFRHELYNHKVDVYGWAMIAYQLITGVPPFWQYDPVEAAKLAALEGRRPEWALQNRHQEEIPASLIALVERCWAPNFDDRPELDDVIFQLEQLAACLAPTITPEPAPPPPPAPPEEKGCCCLQ